jgi:glycosyltransferase involved in cell wall biosynthesis
MVKSCFEPLPDNLLLVPPQQFDKLGQYYQNASFYAQLSRSEGLPNALCEAMLCGCIPVGTDVGDIRITIGHSGMTVNEWNPQILAEFIRANHNHDQLRDIAREQIIQLYDNTRRAERFKKLVEQPH